VFFVGFAEQRNRKLEGATVLKWPRESIKGELQLLSPGGFKCLTEVTGDLRWGIGDRGQETRGGGNFTGEQKVKGNYFYSATLGKRRKLLLLFIRGSYYEIYIDMGI